MATQEEHIKAILAQAPPLDDEKRAKLTAIFAQAVEE